MEGKNPNNFLGGHKVCLRESFDQYCIDQTTMQATLKNPNVSEEAKEHSRQAIEELEAQPSTQETREGYEEDKDEVRVNAGYKATLKSKYYILAPGWVYARSLTICVDVSCA